MVEPGSGERVPLKVVPIFIDEPVVAERAEAGSAEHPDAPPQQPRRKTPLLGAVALSTAVIAGVLQGVAIAQATVGDYLAATVLAYASAAVAVLAVVVGVVAIVMHRGRRLGVAAAVMGLIANPLVLLALFRVLGTPTS